MLSEKRIQMQGIIQNLENNLNIATEKFLRTGDPTHSAEIDMYGKKLKAARDEVWDYERNLAGIEIRKNLKLLSVGYGFVGGAVGDHIKNHVKEHVIIDPKFSDEKISDHADAQAAIVCLPTPTVDGKCDDSLVRDVINELIAVNPEIKILLKSTLSPEQLESYPINVTYNPEFLRAASAREDYANQQFMIIGGGDRPFWHRVFLYFDGLEIIRTDRGAACMVKYFHNTWLAMKVAYFHEVFDLVGDKYDHDETIEILSKFENVGPSHMVAPNSEGNLGYSGHCFPKDTEAFFDYTGSQILERVIEVNKGLMKK
jgi:UDP-glucose 6-dehydrogenase